MLPPAIKSDDQGYCNWCPCSCKLHTSPTNCPCSSQDILQASGVRPHVLQCIQNRLAGYCAGYIACMYCCKLLTAVFLSSFQLTGFIYHDCRSRYSLRDVCQCTSKHSAANTALLHCTLHLNISMIQALYRAVQISASLGSVSEIHSTKETAYSYRRPST